MTEDTRFENADAIVRVRFKTTAEGGRQSPIRIGEPPYGCPLVVDGKTFDCRLLVSVWEQVSLFDNFVPRSSSGRGEAPPRKR
jgi:hypothetical protein